MSSIPLMSSSVCNKERMRELKKYTCDNNYKGLVTGDEVWFPNTFIAASYILIGKMDVGASVVLDASTGSVTAVVERLIESTGQHYLVSEELYEAVEACIMDGSFQVKEELLNAQNFAVAA